MSLWNSAYVDVSGLQLHYHRTGGTKPPLVLAHGITDNGLCWSRVARILAQSYDVVMYDARGHGLSAAPETGYNIVDHANDLVGLVAALELEQPRLLGHSMGAATVAMVAANHPYLAHSIVLEDPPLPQNDDLDQVIATHRMNMQERRHLAAQQQSYTREELMAIGRSESSLWAEEEFAIWAEAKHQVSLNIFNDTYLSRVPWQETFRKIECPILLITADIAAGAFVTSEQVAELHTIWQQGEVTHISGAGHNIRRDQFEQYIAAINTFWQAKTRYR
ncbi:MAG: alpha/beta fold hydrolase [Chloroflexi bacterium AL-W]|nr:alpha/beta fold hydrolase [Chloroflexi bacterium AL-N1]NOK69020.1 alpha/beta fold hydrolase [Chloroflexi bacterium AL-N10]NOK77003.1 alpha/beta fold hydrolase [Chloroflexi bacterium AL-N5]NOK82609.1 alpha/beta fold hydrolase [Chloroflexi bacterium AL-W]NOK90860.1 alpha/beta fold hydrolase [Chloroflexi bacterium AL-N15]